MEKALLPKQVKKTRKRKSKFENDARNMIDNFKKSLIDPKSSKITLSGTNLSSYKKSNLKNINKSNTESSGFFTRKNHSVPSTEMPKWKTTATGTPIFPIPYNPNWANLNDDTENQVDHKLKFKNINQKPIKRRNNSVTELLKDQQKDIIKDKLYTPGHIENWMDISQNNDEIDLSAGKSDRYLKYEFIKVRVAFLYSINRLVEKMGYLLEVI